jgi:hypothetical protein
MNKLFPLALLGITLQFSTIAQVNISNLKTKWGPEIKSSRHSSFEGIIGKDSKNIYALQEYASRGDATKIELLSYDKNTMTLNTSSIIKLDEEISNRALEKIVQIGENIYLFTYVTDKKTDKNTLSVQEVDRNTLTIKPKTTQLAEIDFGNNGRRNRGNFNVAISQNDEYILINYINPREGKYSKQQVGMKVYDKNFNLLWEKLDELEFPDDFFTLKSMIISNSGNVFVLGNVIPEKRDRSNKKQEFQLYAYTDLGDEIVQYPLIIKDKYIDQMTIALTESDDIIVGGLYGLKDMSKISGTFYLRIDGNTQQVEASSFKEFPLDFITEGMNEKQEKKTKKKAEKGKDVGLYSYELRNLTIADDGSVSFIAEQSYVVVNTYTDANGVTRTTYTYYDNDIIMVYVNAEGEITDNIKIPKYQRSGTAIFSSYLLGLIGDDAYFIFNDNVKNLAIYERSKMKPFTGQKNAVAVIVKVDSEGRQKKSALFNAKEVGTLLRPKVSKQFKTGEELYLVGQKGKKLSLGRISLE